MNTRTLLLIIGGAAVVLCCIVIVIAVALGALGGFAAFGLTQPAVDTGDKFMSALRDDDYDTAWRLCAPSLQRELGDREDLQDLIDVNDVVPVSWSFTSRNLENDTAELSGNVTFTRNRQGEVELVLGKTGGDWKITGFSLRER